MTDKEATRWLAMGVIVAAMAIALLIAFGCTIVIGDSNRVDQEINTDSRLRSRMSVDDSNNKGTTKDPQQPNNGETNER